MEFYVPTNAELTENITAKVEDSFAELVFVAESGSYEKRSCFKLIDAFDRLNKCSYGSLMDFSRYCINVSRYYKNPKAKELLSQVIKDIDRFLASYEHFLM